MQDQKEYMSAVLYVQENIPLLCQRLRTSTGMIQASLTLLGDTVNKLEQCLTHLGNIRSQLTIPSQDASVTLMEESTTSKDSSIPPTTTQSATKPRNGRRARRDHHSVSISETCIPPAAKAVRTKARSTKVKSSRHSSWD